MAFDKPTRNRLAKFVADARGVIADEFTEQFQSLFGISAKGEIASLGRLGHLDDAEMATARLLRERIDYLVRTHPDDKDGVKAAVSRLAREQAFTVLNRLAAIRMAEKRGLIVESVGQGYQSKGFQVFERIAGSGLGDTYHRYRRYLFCLFDELAIDLGVLFDRHSPQALLFPRESALLSLLDLLNDAELERLWAEDETIGWIYQYYNDPDERKKMRKESAAPRNSRELAVRNQFFTPRYVVEFLTDNTLGRIWYEMTRGQTRLAEQCRYLVRRPNEIFLQPVDEYLLEDCRDWVREVRSGNFAAAELDASWDEISSVALAIDGYAVAEQLGLGDVHDYVRERGERAIEEGVVDDATLLDQWLLLFSVQRGILREGLQGRDPKYGKAARAVWEAWVRAAKGETAASGNESLSQEELLKQPVFIPHRPLKDPREIRLLDPACGSMHFGLYAFDLFEAIYEEAWELEAGSPLVREDPELKPLRETFESKEGFLCHVPRLIIEHNIHGIDIDPRAVQIAGLSLWLRAQKAWQARGVKPADRPRVRRSNIVCAEPMPGSPGMLEDFVATLKPDLLGELVKTVFDKMQLAGEAGSLLKIEEEIRTAIDTARKEWLKQQDDLLTRKDGSQEEFFDTAEQQVIDALRAYAEQADADSYQRRLFADDAARGFAFIDLCRKCYDAVVMNPPFGETTKQTETLNKKKYTSVPPDLYCQFVARGDEITWAENGKVGAITNSSFILYTDFSGYRELMVNEKTVGLLLNLGSGVLDAYVDAAAYVFDRSSSKDGIWASDVRAVDHKGSASLEAVAALNAGQLDARSSFRKHEVYSLVPGAPLCHWASDTLWRISAANSLLNQVIQEAGVGGAPVADFFRVRWEVPPSGSGFGKRWVTFPNGGYFSPFYREDYLVVDWLDDGKAAKADLNHRYPYLNGNIGLRIQREPWYGHPGIVFGKRTDRFTAQPLPAGAIFSFNGISVFTSDSDRLVVLAFLNTRFAAFYLNLICGLHKNDVYIRRLPLPNLTADAHRRVLDHISRAIDIQRQSQEVVETSIRFVGPALAKGARPQLLTAFSTWRQSDRLVEVDLIRLRSSIDSIFEQALGVDHALRQEIEVDQGPDLSGYPDETDEVSSKVLEKALQAKTPRCREEICRDNGAKSSDVLRVAHFLQCSASTAASSLNSENLIDLDDLAASVMELENWLVGLCFGRWDIRYATGERQPPELPDPFDPLPVCPPGMLQSAEGLPAEPKDVPADYPLRISWPGILVDDENHPEDIVARVREAIEVIWKDRAEAIEQEACGILGVKTLRDYFRRPAAFFADHLKRYSKSRRQAPIYWPLSTKSGSYTLWLYYHRLTDQTLHTCLADFLDPKLRKVQSELDALTASGGGGTRAGELREFLDELHDLRDEIERVIKLPWKPNLNDGVLITASPLHKLFRLPKWQKDLKACWDKLAKGDYDWAHLAYTIRPREVEKACEKDRSIAIAHGLEHLCKVEPPKPKKKRGKKAAAEEESEETEVEMELDD